MFTPKCHTSISLWVFKDANTCTHPELKGLRLFPTCKSTGYLSQLHECWQKTRDPGSESKGTLLLTTQQEQEHYHILLSSACPDVLRGEADVLGCKPKGAVGYVTGEEPWPWGTWILHDRKCTWNTRVVPPSSQEHISKGTQKIPNQSCEGFGLLEF